MSSSADGGKSDGHAERARAIVDSLGKLSSEEVFAAFEELDGLPSEVVRAVLASSTGPAPDPECLDDVTRRAHGFPARALQLRTLSVTKDADIFDLGPTAAEQLRVAGKAWDGRDLEPEERLDGEVEDSFAGTVELHTFANAEDPGAAPLFDALLYAGDAGTIFRAGTTEIVGAIAYGIVEMKDRRSRVAIQRALGRSFVAPVSGAAPREPERVSECAPVEPDPNEARPRKKVSGSKKRSSAATKKTASAPKKASAKKASVKKPLSKSSLSGGAAKVSKQAGAKKAGAKKAGAKKAGTKQAGAKQAGTKKSSAKQAGAKQAGTKKSSAKKSSAKQAGAKQAGAKQAGAKQAGAKQKSAPAKARKKSAVDS